MKFSRRPIDVEQVFSEDRVRQLAETAKISSIADLAILQREVQEAARIYLRDGQEPDSNDLYRELVSLHKAADHERHDTVADILRTISPQTRHMLEERAAIQKCSLADLLALPDKKKACEQIASLCRDGGTLIEGRRRPSGRRSRTLKIDLHARIPSRHFEKRKAELNFVTWLEFAWREATNQPPSATASHEKPGPYARFVGECLKLVGATHADAIALINEHTRRREEAKKEMEEKKAVR